MKTIIEFYTEPNGTQPVRHFLQLLKARAEQSEQAKDFYKLVLRGLRYLNRYGLLHCLHQTAVLEREDGKPYSIRLVKELKGCSPLMEFRINWKSAGTEGAARILFVELPVGEHSVLVLLQGVVKSATTDSRFVQAREEALALLPALFANPGRYIHLP